MNRSLFRHAFSLILLTLIGSLAMPAMAIPRLGLSAHTIGILSGVLLIALGAIWSQFTLSPRLHVAHKWSWLFSSYMNWFACMLAGFVGAGKMTPIAAAGQLGPQTIEAGVSLLFISVAISSFIAVGLSLWGLRSEQ